MALQLALFVSVVGGHGSREPGAVRNQVVVVPACIAPPSHSYRHYRITANANRALQFAFSILQSSFFTGAKRQVFILRRWRLREYKTVEQCATHLQKGSGCE